MTGDKMKRAAQLAELMDLIRAQATFNGVVLIAEKGEVLISEAMGIAELGSDGHHRMVNVDSMFELASVSKPITALGIVRLQQQGKLQWDDLVSNWLPELPYPGITIRHLLCQTSGLPDYIALFAKVWDRGQYAYNEDVLQMLATHQPEPLFQPNDGWLYSNTGYIILALLIERISGQTYGDFLAEQIFQPLGMTRTRVYNRRVDEGPVPENYALGYVYRLEQSGYVLPDEVPEMDYVVYLDGLQGDGMVNSTAGDLLRLDQALADDCFISPQLRELMFTPVVMNNGESFNYGFGWLIECDERLGHIVHHSGGWPGYSTMFKRYTDQDMTLIILQNGEKDNAYTQQLILGIEQIMAGESFEVPQPLKDRTIVSVPQEEYMPYLGKYKFVIEDEKPIDAEVYSDNEYMHMRLGNGMVLKLLPLSSTRYYEQQTATELEFSKGETGKSNQLTWYDHTGGHVAERVD